MTVILELDGLPTQYNLVACLKADGNAYAAAKYEKFNLETF